MRTSLLFALLLVLASCTRQVQERETSVTPIVIVHSNDIHGRAWPFLREDGKWVGGYAAQARVIAQLRREAEKNNAAFLLLSAGDVNTGVPESDFSEARPDFESMKAIGYDAMVAGNHDFDHGLDLLLKQLTWVNFPVLANNIKLKESQRELFPGDLVIERRGIRFGILGVTTDQLKKLIFPEHADRLVVEDAIQATRRTADKLKKKGSEVLIALSHLGVSESGLSIHRLIPNDDRKLAKMAPDLDLIVGGHSHTFIKDGITEGNTLIVQAGYRGDYLGKVELLWDSEKKHIISKKAQLVEVATAEGVDAGIEKLVQPYKDKYETELGIPVFEAKRPILGQRNRTQTLELPLGNLICDALRIETKTDVAFFNSGGIRSNLPGGVVKRRDILEAFPFRNLVSTGILTGKHLVSLLNDGLRGGDFSGAVLQVSGLSYEIKNGKVSKVSVGNQKLDLNRDYTFSTNSYVSSAGDRLKSISKARS
ncbi:hypothetical protein EBT16_05825, partial [bacterium]|nr:hypothetical protein [bacterium]